MSSWWAAAIAPATVEVPSSLPPVDVRITEIFATPSSKSGDANGDGILDACAGSIFRRGDGNDDAGVDISDPIAALSILFGGAPAPTCEDAHDSNDDGAFDISDPIYTLTFLFGSGLPMPEPGSVICGPDPSVDSLECDSYTSCL